ncbi:FMN-binding negative transcriptional regulator [Streptacidiphilus fuscans]|uniref:FMN-binding negative transcriptional regulator n=1 Tax=Streptacidiphilus fuscans TaxID=2789292 RepID=A0A931AX86_9ACTN|nr:FMN-binding negative transcriptional regulator [Streptacidiphilus fuscans]MBF9067064.1 FMN-binding negative transcriptional regulator [Streptacidiphilus fuscans]
MLELPVYALTDPSEIRSLIADRGWATLVSAVPGEGPVVSHLPVILDPDRDDATVLGHLARTDAELHELGQHPTVLILEGPNGYISPSFYQSGPYVPTWNFVVAHLHGTPEILTGEQTYEVLDRTVAHFEDERPTPWRLSEVEGYAQSIAPATTGFRLTPSRVVAKAKLSQDKPVDVARNVITALHSDTDTHRNPALAQAMSKALSLPV